MSKLMDTQTLLERVRAATGGDRELDARLHAALFPDQEVMTHPGNVRLAIGSEWGTLREFSFDGWADYDWPVVADTMSAPTYTASLDCALALVERVRPGWTIGLDLSPYHAEAFIEAPPAANGWNGDFEHAATLPLALLAALLASLQHEGEGG